MFLKFDAHDNLYSVQNDTFHDIYAESDYISSYSATLPRIDTFVKSTKNNLDRIQHFSMIRHPN